MSDIKEKILLVNRYVPLTRGMMVVGWPEEWGMGQQVRVIEEHQYTGLTGRSMLVEIEKMLVDGTYQLKVVE